MHSRTMPYIRPNRDINTLIPHVIVSRAMAVFIGPKGVVEALLNLMLRTRCDDDELLP